MNRSVILTGIILGVPTILVAAVLIIFELKRDNWEVSKGLELDQTLADTAKLEKTNELTAQNIYDGIVQEAASHKITLEPVKGYIAEAKKRRDILEEKAKALAERKRKADAGSIAKAKAHAKVEAQTKEKEDAALRFSKQWVRDHLKHPDDATFSAIETSILIGSDVFYCFSKVKAKNDFGSELTHQWFTVTLLDGNTWKLVSCQIDYKFIDWSNELVPEALSRIDKTHKTGLVIVDILTAQDNLVKACNESLHPNSLSEDATQGKILNPKTEPDYAGKPLSYWESLSTSNSIESRKAAITVLRTMGPSAITTLVKLLRDKDPNVRLSAARTLGNMGVEA
jgi:hypothetical protein